MKDIQVTESVEPAPAPPVDVPEFLRVVCMTMIVRGHDKLGREMLEALRGDVYDACDIDASVGLALAGRGDYRSAIELVDREVLCKQPDHALSLLVKAVSERALGTTHWKKSAQRVIKSDAPTSLRSFAREMCEV
jgi:hypothetical protein